MQRRHLLDGLAAHEAAALRRLGVAGRKVRPADVAAVLVPAPPAALLVDHPLRVVPVVEVVGSRRPVYRQRWMVGSGGP